jgi:hypothetical protein
VSISAVPAVYTAGYLGVVQGVVVALAAWVVSLYGRVFVNYFRQLTSPKELEQAN